LACSKEIKFMWIQKQLTFLLCVVLFASNGLHASTFSLQNGSLTCNRQPVLQGIPNAFTLVEDPSGVGVFLKLGMESASSRVHSPLGTVSGMTRFTSLFRDEPFWMRPITGNRLSELKVETQWLLAETTNLSCVMLVPMFDGPMVFTLSGRKDGLTLTGVTADPQTTARGGVALFVMVGSDPYQMCDAGAKAVMKHLGTGKLRREKPLPDFVDNFGWCTWNSFYRDVTPDKVRAGLATFAKGGVEPRFLILDDGWQDYREVPKAEQYLVSLNAGKNFNGDLSSTVRIAKDEFKVKQFLVWHAFTGYWSGLDSHTLPDYDVRDTFRDFEPGVLAVHPNYNTQWWGHAVGVIPPHKIAQFYDDYHRRLQMQGVDGVKVDNQSMIESVAHGLAGRVALTRAYREALEKSVNKHFGGRLINCMANAMETYYCSPRSTLMRTSIDFWPKRPETHGAASLLQLAQVSVWFGEFMQPDWDMFQSGHPMGAFHAAGRAVSGGPVYVSDKIDGQLRSAAQTCSVRWHRAAGGQARAPDARLPICQRHA
jgi:raffinose synthase